MRLYSVALASLAVNAPLRWTDNLLTLHDIEDVRSETRGVARKIGYSALLRLAVIRDLHSRLGLGVGDAVALSARLLEPDAGAQIDLGCFRLSLDLPSLQQSLQDRLRDVIESAPQPRRGRPPGKRK